MSNTRVYLCSVSGTARSIKRAREKRGLSQQDLADLVGVTRSSIKRLEGAEVATVDAKLLDRITRVLTHTSRIAGDVKSGGSRTPKTPRAAQAKSTEPTARKASKTNRVVLARQLLEKEGLLNMTIKQLFMYTKSGSWPAVASSLLNITLRELFR